MGDGNGAACEAALIIKGEFFRCDWIEKNMPEGTTDHYGWAHANSDAQASWSN